MIYEAQSYHWRTDAKNIYVIFGDAPPHAAPSGATLMKPWAPAEKLFTRTEAPYGGDPGVDEIAGTSDDLDYAPVVDDVAASHIIIVGVYCPNGGTLDDQHADAENNFRYMAYMTGGLFVVSDPNGDPSAIAAQIVAMIQDMAKQNIRNLGIQAEEPGTRTGSHPPTVIPMSRGRRPTRSTWLSPRLPGQRPVPTASTSTSWAMAWCSARFS